VKRDLILKSVLIAATLMGIFFRFYHLDTKAYWFDETFTSLRISGSSDKELVEGIRANGGLMSASQLRQYQIAQPGRTVIDTVRGLAIEEPQNPPPYFAAARLWADLAGSSISATRLLPALFSLLVLPLTYWLCRELFESAFVGWVAVAVVSLSPLHVLFAQTARPQSLWTATILLSSSALLWALRTGSIAAWCLYTVSLIISFYTFILSGLFIAGFGVYVLATAGFRLTKSVFAFVISSALAMLAFIPWAIVLLFGRNNVAATTDWTNSKLSLFELVRAWMMGVVRLFFDINNQSSDTPAQLLPVFIVLPLLSVLVGCSLYFVWKNAARHASLDGFTDVFYFHPGWEPPSYLPALTKSSEYGVQSLVSQRGRTALWKVERRANF
jgi:uncharacterized membrane protein